MESKNEEIIRAIEDAVGTMTVGACKTLWNGKPNEQARPVLKALAQSLDERGTPIATAVLHATARAAAGNRLANRLGGLWESGKRC